MRSHLRTLFRVVPLALAAAIAIAAGLAAWWVQRPNPSYEGSLTLAPLEQPASVQYGPHAVPSIRARTLEDMLVVQGFVVARERFWQMDLLRRLAGGRLAELFGEDALVADRFYRTIGLAQAAGESFAALEPRWQRLLDRYADGVNAYLDQARAENRLPLEYQLLGVEASRWQAVDSLLIGAYMGWLNSVNLREELVFLRMAQRLGSERALELFPADQGQAAPPDAQDLPDYRRLLAVDPQALLSPAALATLFAQIIPGQGLSNAWAVTGDSTADGSAMLANDPHLPTAMPSTWYELEMQAPGYHATGVALPGVPWILIGHNADLAWGITAAVADTQDLFLERVHEDNARVLRPDGSWEPIKVRVEQIAVAGPGESRGAAAEAGIEAATGDAGEAPDMLGSETDPKAERQPWRWVELPIRSTRHGVLIDELIQATGANPAGLAAFRSPPHARVSVALRLALDQPDRGVVGFFRLNTATRLEQARAAVDEIDQVALNMLFAHRDGRIAWQVSGLLPHRGRGSGTFPVPAWETGYGWEGYRPFADNPGVTAPSADRLVSANNAMVSADDDAAAISHSWLAPFRAQRIEALLDTLEPIDLEQMLAMQSDRVSLEAVVYMGSLRRHLAAIRRLDPEAAAVADRLLLDWTGGFDGSSQAAAFFVLLRSQLYRALYGDELGEDLELLMRLDTHTYGPLAEAMYSDRSSFWDDIDSTDVEEGPAAVWAQALRASEAAWREAVPGEQAPNLAQLRQLTFAHAFDGQPLLGDLFNLGPIGRGGDNQTIDVALAPLTSPRRIGNVASMRVVYVPAAWSETRGTLPLGQSGHRFSSYRADQLDDWLNGRTHRWLWGGPAAGQLLGTLSLLPGSEPGSAAAGSARSQQR